MTEDQALRWADETRRKLAGSAMLSKSPAAKSMVVLARSLRKADELVRAQQEIVDWVRTYCENWNAAQVQVPDQPFLEKALYKVDRRRLERLEAKGGEPDKIRMEPPQLNA